MLMPLLLVLISVVVSGGGIYLLVARQKNKGVLGGQLVGAFTDAFDRMGKRALDPEGKPLNHRWHVQRDDTEMEASHLQTGNGPPSFTLHAEIAATPMGAAGPFRGRGDEVIPRLPKLVLRAENRRDRLGKALRLNHEMQTGDEDFDREVYIECDAREEEARVVLGLEPLRNGVRAILELGATSVELGAQDGRLTVHWKGSQKENPFRDARLDDVVTEVARLHRELPSFASVEADQSWPAGGNLLAATIVAVVVGFGALALGSIVFQPIDGDAVRPFVLASLPIMVLVDVMTWWYARGTSRALRMIGWVTGLGLLGWPLLFGGTTMVLNGLFDGKPYTREVVVQRTYKSKSKDSVSYYAVLETWPPHGDPVKVKIDDDDYLWLTEGKATLIVGRGALGIEWYRGFRRP